MSNKKSLVNRYCELRHNIDTLKTEEKVLRDMVLKEFTRSGSDKLIGDGGNIILKVVSCALTINPRLFFKRVSVPDFIKSVRVSITQARSFIGSDEIVKISHKGEKISLTVNP